MNRFEKKAIDKIREIDMYDKIKQVEIIAKALEQEYKNGRNKKAKHKLKMTTKEKAWIIKLAKYLNSWADENKHPERAINNKRTMYGVGYEDCVRDIVKKFPRLSKIIEEVYPEKPYKRAKKAIQRLRSRF